MSINLQQLQQKLKGFILYTNDGKELKMTGAEALRHFESSFKPARTQKGEACTYRKALTRAIRYITGTRHIENHEAYVFKLVKLNAPTLTEQAESALSEIKTHYREKFGLLSKLYYDPITINEMNSILENISEMEEMKTQAATLSDFLWNLEGNDEE